MRVPLVRWSASLGRLTRMGLKRSRLVPPPPRWHLLLHQQCHRALPPVPATQHQPPTHHTHQVVCLQAVSFLPRVLVHRVLGPQVRGQVVQNSTCLPPPPHHTHQPHHTHLVELVVEVAGVMAQPIVALPVVIRMLGWWGLLAPASTLAVVVRVVAAPYTPHMPGHTILVLLRMARVLVAQAAGSLLVHHLAQRSPPLVLVPVLMLVAPMLVAPMLVVLMVVVPVRVGMQAPAPPVGAVRRVLVLVAIWRVRAVSSAQWRLVGHHWVSVVLVLVGVVRVRRNPAKSKQLPALSNVKATYAPSSATHHSSYHQSSATTSATNPTHSTHTPQPHEVSRPREATTWGWAAVADRLRSRLRRVR